MRKFFEELKDFFKKGDMTLLILILIVAGFGCVCMASATMADKFGDSNLKYIVVQILAIGLGMVMYAIVSSLDVEVMSEHRYLLVGCVGEKSDELMEKLDNRRQRPGWV